MPTASLPEKVLQFGTGVLLRGLPDFFIHQANQRGVFNGRIVAVKSTRGSVQAFADHDCRYTTCVRGMEAGKDVQLDIECTSISRVLSAEQDWQSILDVAARPEVCVIVSNTTEVGITYVEESVLINPPPSSYPAKLTAVLYERFRRLGNDAPPVVVIPTELIPDNGKILKEMVARHAEHNQLGGEFATWQDLHVVFSSSLVDRIVTPPSEQVMASLPADQRTSLTIQTEPYRLWAIEGDEKVRRILSFANGEEGIIIAHDIGYYRERKLRLLNGTGTVMASLGFVNGLNTTFECMMDPMMGAYVRDTMLAEVEPTLPEETRDDSTRFAHDVLERWRNSYIVHKLLSVTLQATAKMKMRNVATLFRYAERFGKTPDLLARGFAAHLLFMRAVHKDGNQFTGLRDGEPYAIHDDSAEYFSDCWRRRGSSPGKLVKDVSERVGLWGADLTKLPRFVEIVTTELADLMRQTRIGS